MWFGLQGLKTQAQSPVERPAPGDSSTEMSRYRNFGLQATVLRHLALLLVCFAWPWQALAATYTFRGDTYQWESAANVVSWDNTCTGFPSDDDKATIALTGGFKFKFAGTDYTSVRVLSNGGLQFGADTGFAPNYANTPLPVADSPSTTPDCASGPTDRVMLAYWTDLDPGHTTDGNVTWAQKGTAPNRYLVVSWNSVYQYGTSTPYTFQIILYENGEFKYQYGNSNASGSNATIGVQVNATDFTLYSYNSGYNANGTAVRWYKPSGASTRVAEYRFDEYAYSGTLGEVNDSSGNGHSGLRVGQAASTANGRICRALDIPANSDSSSAGMDTAVDVDTALGNRGSLSFWFRSNTAWNSGSAGILADATTLASRPFYLMRNGDGSLRFALSDSAGTALQATTAALTTAAGTWVHVAATWRLAAGSNQSTLRLFVNGAQVAVANGTTNGSLDPSLGTLYVGDNRSAAQPAGATRRSANGGIDELRLYNYDESPADVAGDMAVTHACLPPLHHLELRSTTGSSLTCSPGTVTVAACSDLACTTPFTGGVVGVLTATGTGMTVNWPDGAGFNIPVNASSVNVRVWPTTVGSAVLGAGVSVPSAVNPVTCNFGNPACTWLAADSGFVLDVPNHLADQPQSVAITAVKRATGAATCVPAFANVTRNVNFACLYLNPTSGNKPVRVAGVALNAGNSLATVCDAAGRDVPLAFDANGATTLAVQYADVGQVSLTARYLGSASTGDPGLTMTGTDAFISAPASFRFGAVTPATLRAGSAFATTVTVLNASGTVTPNFGRETVAESATLGFVRRQPTGAGASDGVFSGSTGAFSAGVATASNLVWTEVGSGDLTARLTSASYLGSGLSATGTTGSAGAVGRFKPHHFDVAVTQACSAGAFTYAGQPAQVTITARNGLATPGTTVNYDGSAATSPNQAQSLLLSEATSLGLGSLSGTAVSASAFLAGVATAAPSYTYTTKTTGPRALALRAIDADGVSSLGYLEGSVNLRSGRLRLPNAFGSSSQALRMPVLAEYWTGQAWLLNSADSCTTLPAAAVAVSNARNHLGNTSTATTLASAVTLSGGNGVLTLAAPTPAASVSFDVALNLGATAADQSCNAAHPATAPGARAWLRAANGSCAVTADRDPASRASFGLYAPETRKTVHARELF